MKAVPPFLILACLMYASPNAQPSKTFSKQEAIQDFEYLENAVESAHYDPYAYTSKAVFVRAERGVTAAFHDGLGSLEIFRLLQPYVALAKMSHFSISYPFDDYGNYAGHGGTLLPLDVRLVQGKAFVKDNYSSDRRVASGDELLALNERPLAAILKDLRAFCSGESEYALDSHIDAFNFSRMYWFVFGRSDVFELKIRRPSGGELTVSVPAISVGDFEAQAGKHPVIEYRDYKRELRFISDNIAYLRPGPFMNASAEGLTSAALDNREFLQFLESSFAEIHMRRPRHLILDLRSNPGGTASFSMQLIAYIATKPFRSVKVTYRTGDVTKDGMRRLDAAQLAPEDASLRDALLSHPDGSRFAVPRTEYQPKGASASFAGRVIVLVNRFTYSEAVVAASLIQDYGFGTLVGEPTPYGATMYASSQVVELPNTKLKLAYPRAFLERTGGSKASRSHVIPDHQRRENPLADRDGLLEYALELIRISGN
jgi:C-terminal processing protease CtpA/Prc